MVEGILPLFGATSSGNPFIPRKWPLNWLRWCPSIRGPRGNSPGSWWDQIRTQWTGWPAPGTASLVGRKAFVVIVSTNHDPKKMHLRLNNLPAHNKQSPFIVPLTCTWSTKSLHIYSTLRKIGKRILQKVSNGIYWSTFNHILETKFNFKYNSCWVHVESYLPDITMCFWDDFI